MKAVLLAPLPPPAGGIASWAKRMEAANLKNGWSVIIVDEKVIGGREIFGKNAGKKDLLTEIKRCLKIWRNLIATMYDNEVKIVHSSIPAGVTGMLREIVCAVITKYHGRKFIIHYRCTVPNMVKTKLQRGIFSLLTNMSDAVISLNSASEEFIKQHSKIPVKLIPNFVSYSELQNEKKENADFTVLYVGGVIPEKGCMDIIEAAKRLPDIHFHLVGAVGNEINNMESIPSNIILFGERDRPGVQEAYRSADVFLFASYFHGEGFSNALAEAMAAGLPCIVSNWAANADMIGSQGGFLVGINDISGIENSIRKLQNNPELRERMGSCNKKKVKEVYSQENVTGQYIDLYEQLLTN